MYVPKTVGKVVSTQNLGVSAATLSESSRVQARFSNIVRVPKFGAGVYSRLLRRGFTTDAFGRNIEKFLGALEVKKGRKIQHMGKFLDRH